MNTSSHAQSNSHEVIPDRYLGYPDAPQITELGTRSSRNPPQESSAIDAPPHALDRKIQISINSHLKNKSTADKRLLAQEFERVEITVGQLIEHVRLGHAYSYVYAGTHRAAKNFVATDVVSVDIDAGMTLEQALDDPFIKRICTFIYTTASHEETAHRFRIVCVLDERITSADYLSNIAIALAHRFNGDSRTVGAAQLFFGNTEATVIEVGGSLGAEDIDELLVTGAEAGHIPNDEAEQTSRSSTRIGKSQLIRGATGLIAGIFDFPDQASVHCPFHDDQTPSARVYVKPNEARFIHCFACNKTYWADRNSGVFDFNSFERAANGSGALGTTQVMRIDVPFLNTLPLATPGINFIRSPKGTGKTNLLATTIPPDASVLLVGHRKALLRNLSDRLALDCYLDVKSKIAPSRFAVCMDSLPRFKLQNQYQYVILDESEQVLSHIVGDTMKEKRYSCIITLQKLIRHRDVTVICLDADLSWVSYKTIMGWSNGSAAKSRLFFNDLRKEPGRIEVVESKSQITADIISAVAAGLKCYVASNAKSYIDKLGEALKANCPNSSFLAITSDTSRVKDSPVGQFILNPLMEAVKYDAVLASPTVGTGVDISFPTDQQYYDIVFGVFEAGITTHFECDQQLSRVRNPKSVKVFVAPRRQALEHSREVVAEDIRRWDIFDYSHFLFAKGFNEIEDGSGLRDLVIEVEVTRRASLNNLKGNFLDYKQDEGWEIIFAPKISNDVVDGTKYLREGGEAFIAARVAAIIGSPKLRGDEVSELVQRERKGELLSQEQHDGLARAALEEFYRQDITKSVVQYELENKAREKILLFCDLAEFARQTRSPEPAENSGTVRYVGERAQRAGLLHEILSTTPIYDGLAFRADVHYQHEELGNFVSFILSNKDCIERTLEISIRKDLTSMPMRQLSDFLRMLNLDSTNSGTKTVRKKRTYYYKISSFLLECNIDTYIRRYHSEAVHPEIEMRKL